MEYINIVLKKVRRLGQVGANAYWEYKPLFTLRRLTTPLREIEIDRPIFLLGVQGCGLTLLTRMLQRQGRVVTIGGGRKFWVGNNEMDKQCIRELPEDFVLRSPRFQSPVFKKHMRGDERSHPIFGTERCWVYASNDMVDKYRRTAADWTPQKEETVRQVIKESLRAYSDSVSGTRFVDMSQSFILKIPLLRQIFPQAKFIVQTRNPYATCLKEALDTSYEWRRHASMETKLQLFSENWCNSYRYALNDLDEVEASIFIRYEDLVSRPETTLKKVLAAAELSFSQNMLPQRDHQFPFGATERHKWYPIRPNENEKYLEKISPEYASLIENGIRPLAERFGYSNPS